MAETPTIEIHDPQKGYLTLPFDAEQFQQFIKGLLGKPQTITKRIRGSFEIQLKDLQNFHDLIEQRITQQNGGKLIQLKTKIIYNDESSVLLSSYEELVTYNEVKPVISVAVRMSWSYLIKFQEKDVPEKQEIELAFISNPIPNVVEEDDIPIIFPQSGQIRLAIQHTARTWGSDIEALLTNQINSILIKPKRIVNFFKKHSTKLGTIVAALFLIGSLLGIYIANKKFNYNQVEKVSGLTSDPNVSLSQKTDYLLNFLAKNDQSYISIYNQVFFLFSLVIAIILGFWVESLADYKQNSFVILTREAKQNADRVRRKQEKRPLIFLFSLLISIVTGVLSNYLFAWITK